LACSSKEASRARGFEPPSGTWWPFSSTSSDPSIRNFTSAPRPDGNTDTAQPFARGLPVTPSGGDLLYAAIDERGQMTVATVTLVLAGGVLGEPECTTLDRSAEADLGVRLGSHERMLARR
jgi:hypothetical protein